MIQVFAEASQLFINSSMRAITVKQPWPYSIFHEGKDIENRSQNIKLPLPIELAIHVSKTPDNNPRYPKGRKVPAIDGIAYDKKLRGKIVGVVTLEAIVEKHPSKWYQGGTYAYVISNPRLLKTPLEARGFQSHWKVPANTLKKFNCL
jgi:hypothetical protein